MLTGESVPVAKATNVVTAHSAPIADRRNMVFRGTVVTGGAGRAVVTATGPETELGRIQSLLGSEDQPATPLQRQLDALGRQLVFGSVAACGLFAAIGLIRGFGLLSLLKTVTSLAVAAVPEGLPTLATTTLALAIQDLRRRRIIIRRLGAVEGLAGVDIACFDKTGTLTLNDMSVVRLYWNETRARLADGQFHTAGGAVVDCTTDRELVRLLELAILCNDVELLDAAAGDANGSATELALVRAALQAGLDVETVRERHPRRATIERAEDRRYMVTVHDALADRKLVIVKGDPSEVLALCRWRLDNGVVTPLEDEDRRGLEAANLDNGRGCIACARDCLPNGRGRGSRRDDRAGFHLDWPRRHGRPDPEGRVEPDWRAAPRRGHERHADRRPTGYGGRGRQRAGPFERQSGDSSSRPANSTNSKPYPDTGGDLPRVFARVAPGQKLQLVRKLQRSGMVVAMIGDGVNDTPPLRAADIGIALGRSGVDAARGIADIVLLDDDLASLADAIERGRTVAINIRKSIRYLVATNLSEIIFMLVAAAAGQRHPLSPIQLLWINLLTDVLPALGLAMEPADPDLMTRPPADSRGTDHHRGGVRHLGPRCRPDRRQRICRAGDSGKARRLGAVRSNRRIFEPRLGAALLCLRLPLEAWIDPCRPDAAAKPVLFRRPRQRLRGASRSAVHPGLPEFVRAGPGNRRFRHIAGCRRGPAAGHPDVAAGEQSRPA